MAESSRNEKLGSENPPAAGALRWHDEEMAIRPAPLPRPGVQRSSSRSSSMRARRQVDPSVALPIQYRTVSFDIDEGKRRQEEQKTKAKNEAAKDFSSLEWHTLSAHDALQRLSSSPTQGLSAEQATRKLKEHGKNAPAPPPSGALRKYANFLLGGFSPILIIGAVLVFISWKPLGDPPALANLALAIVLVIVWLIQVAFQLYQDWSSNKVMSSIQNMIPEDSLVIRDGNQQSIPAPELVPGDIVLIKAGNKLPADLRFLQVSSDAKFDRSILTGESVPLNATVDHTDTNYLETRNIGLQGTYCVSGSCSGLIVSTGGTTVFGKIATLTQQPSTKMTTLEREVFRFVIIIVSLMLFWVIVIIALWAGWLRKDHPDFINVPVLIVDCVSIAIAYIPEGLPIALTAGLTITASLMRKYDVLCKSLKTVETLGAVSVICSDKTGTLTENRMTVTECAIGGETMTADGTEQEMGRIGRGAVGQLRALAALCNAGEFDAASMDKPIEQRRVHGDATDQAVLRFSERLGSVKQMRQAWQRTYDLAFNSKNKFMIRAFSIFNTSMLDTTLPEPEAGRFGPGDTLLTIKGAPDVLLSRCSHYTSTRGETLPLDAGVRASIEDIKNKYSSQGKRCILLARKTMRHEEIQNHVGSGAFEDELIDAAKSGMTLVGLVALVDPLRPEIRDVVSTLRGAGIRFFMVTGDFALTALSIAQDAGIVSSPTEYVHDVSALPLAPSSSHTGSVDILHHSSGDKLDELTTTTSERKSIVISGPELLKLNEHQWGILTEYNEIVFARTTPEQKLRIVREFQKNGVVAMTGDGVNDAPSLKAADIGIALGGGSDIAIEASDMVLLDSFSSVVEAVKNGRVVFDNLKKVICYLLPAGTFSEFWPVFTSVAFGLPQILSSFLMIIICCLTDAGAAITLSYEKAEADVMLRRPRNPKKDHLVDWRLLFHAYFLVGVIMCTCSFAMSYWYLERQGIPFSQLWFAFGKIPDGVTEEYYLDKLNVASAIYFVNLVVMQWFHLMAVRTRRWSVFQHPPLFNPRTQNRLLFVAIAAALVWAIFFLYLPPLSPILGTVPAPVEYWFFPMAFGIGLLLLDEGRKYMVRAHPTGILARMAW